MTNGEELLKKLSGRHCGIIQDFNLREPALGDWPYYYGSATLCDVGLLSGLESWRPPSGGIAFNKQQATMSIIGEAVERYCSAFKPVDKLVIGTERELLPSNDLFSPNDLSCYSKAQCVEAGFYYSVYNDETEIEWVKAVSISGDENLLVPAAWTFIPYVHRGGYYLDPNSTGLACGSSIEMAIENAVCETIERDAYTLCWLYHGAPPRLIMKNEEWATFLFPMLLHKDWQVTVYDLTGVSGIPVIMVSVLAPRSYGDRHGPWLAHGIACNLNPKVALEKALKEAMLGYFYLESQWQLFFKESSLEKKKFSREFMPKNFDEHALFYNINPKLIRHTKFINGPELLWGESNGTLCEDDDFTYHNLCDRLCQAQIEAAWVDLSTEDISELGLYVVRVLAKGFTWLHGNNQWPYLGTAHAKSPHQYYDYIKSSAKINCWPHSLG